MNRHERRAQAAQGRHTAKPPDHKARLERANQKLSGLVRKAYDDYDGMMAQFLAQTGHTGDRIPCKEGCAHCCDQVVLLTVPEAFEIAIRYPEVVEDVRNELERHEELSRQLGITERVVNIFDRSAAADAERTAYLDRWFEARIPCAFLDPESKRCRIYASRPLNCRSYFVHDQPAERCGYRQAEISATGFSHAQVVQSFPAYDHAASALMKASQEVFHQLGIGPLAPMVLAARDLLKKA